MPRGKDAEYLGQSEGGSGTVRSALGDDDKQLQHIRALPMRPGEPLLFSHRLLHWSSCASVESGARSSFAFVTAEDGFEPVLLARGGDMPSLEERVTLAATQTLVYEHGLVGPDRSEQLSFFFELFERGEQMLHPEYSAKVP